MYGKITKRDLDILNLHQIPCYHCAFKFTKVAKELGKYVITCECGFKRIEVRNRMDLKRYI